MTSLKRKQDLTLMDNEDDGQDLSLLQESQPENDVMFFFSFRAEANFFTSIIVQPFFGTDPHRHVR